MVTNFYFFVSEMYYTACIVAISLAILSTCIVLNFYYKTTNMPRWVQRFILGWLAQILGIKTRINRKQQEEFHPIISNTHTNGDTDHNVVILRSVTTLGAQNNDANEDDDEKRDNLTNGTADGELRNRRSTKSKKVQTSQPNKVSKEDNTEDWRTASRVLDRMSAIIGFVLAVATTVGIFLQAPRVRDFISGKSST